MNIEVFVTMTKSSSDPALEKAKSYVSKGEIGEAHKVLELMMNEYADKLKNFSEQFIQHETQSDISVSDPPEDIIQGLFTMYSSGQLSEVIDIAFKMSQEYPNAVRIWNILGMSAARLNRMEIACYAFRAVVKLEPLSPDSHNNLGNALIESGEPEQGIRCLREALEVRPDFPEAYYNIANAYLDLGLLEKSIEAYTRALECKPDYLEACINMGRALELMDKSCEALKFYQRALKLAPDDAKVQNRFNNLKEKLESKII